MVSSSLPGDPPVAADTPAPEANTTATQPTAATPIKFTIDQLSTDDDAQTEEKAGSITGGETPSPAKKKKKKKKSKNKGGLSKRGDTAQHRFRGSGFEEYYCDPPLTANERWEEENNIYNSDRSFEDRIEDCIQRFRSRRRMNSERNHYFSRYLMLGGIDTTQGQFQSGGFIAKAKKDDSDNEPDEQDIVTDQLSKGDKKRERKETVDRGKDVISDDPKNARFYAPGAEGWVKGDFVGVVSGFLSSWFVQKLVMKEGAVEEAISTISNFLRYVLQHDVCPEYNSSVQQAWEVCERARQEIPMCAEALFEMPGQFNTAARIIFCTDGKSTPCTVDAAKPMITYRETDVNYWEFEEPIFAPQGFSPVLVFKVAMLFRSSQEGVEYDGNIKLDLVDTFHQDYEVVDPKNFWWIKENPERVDKEKAEVYTALAHLKPLKPVGRLFVRPCVIEDGWDNNISKFKEKKSTKIEHFLFEDEILALLKPKMKLRMVVVELSDGLRFVKQVLNVLPTYYTFLPQELMLKYREPKPSDRPAPSVDDPDVEERAMEKMALDDAKE